MSKHGHGIPFEVIEQGEGQLNVAGGWLYNDEKEWNSAGAVFESKGDLYATPWPPPPVGVDWKKSAVILVSAGEFSTSPCQVSIVSITPQGHEATIEAEIQGPGSLQTISTPWVIVKIDRSNLRTVQVNIRRSAPPS